ncbi:unnamed protein product, partial [Thlaspi arvense]
IIFRQFRQIQNKQIKEKQAVATLANNNRNVVALVNRNTPKDTIDEDYETDDEDWEMEDDKDFFAESIGGPNSAVLANNKDLVEVEITADKKTVSDDPISAMFVCLPQEAAAAAYDQTVFVYVMHLMRPTATIRRCLSALRLKKLRLNIYWMCRERLLHKAHRYTRVMAIDN